MTPEQFTYWLQGFTEISQGVPTPEQWGIIKDHLQLVFKKETPLYNKDQIIFTPYDHKMNDRTIIC